jgi:hypothetical protein
MGNQKVIGLVLFAVGLILLFFGWQSSESVGDRISETFTGRFTDETMLFLIGGVVGVVAGGVMAFRK